MPVADYEASVQPEPLPGRPFPHLPEGVTPEETGAPLARGIENLGEVQGQIEQRQYRQAITSQVTNAHNQLQELALRTTHDPQTGALMEEGQNAFNSEARHMPGFDEAAQKIIDSVPDRTARAHAAAAAAEIRNSVLSQIDTHEGEQHRQFAVSTAKTSVSLAQQAAAKNYNHPDIIGNNLETVDVSLGNLAEQQGWSQDQLGEARYQEHARLYAGVLDAQLADNHPELARALFDHVKGELKPQELQAFQRAIQAGEVKATSARILDGYRTSTDAGAQRMTQLVKGLPEEQQSEVIRQVDQGRAELRVLRRQDPQVMRQLTALHDHIADGTAGAPDVASADTLWRHGAISDDERLSMHGQVARVQANYASDQQLLSIAQDAYTKRTPLDPSNKDNRDAVSLLFSRGAKDLQPGSVEYANLAADVTHRTGVAPAAPISWARANLANLANVDPQTAAHAADLVTRIYQGAPRGLDQASRPLLALAAQISDAVRAGTEPIQAVRMAQQSQDMTEAQRKVLEQKWSDANGDKKSVEVAKQKVTLLTALRDSAFTGGMRLPEVPAQLQAEYNELTRDYFRYTGGNLDLAHKLAAEDVKKVWGISTINGAPELMPNAPEKWGATREIVQGDLIKLGIPEPEKVRLVPEPGLTDRTHGLIWNVMSPNKHGLYELLMTADGDPRRYQLPQGEEQQRLRQQYSPGMVAAREQQRREQEAERLQSVFEREPANAPLNLGRD